MNLPTSFLKTLPRTKPLFNERICEPLTFDPTTLMTDPGAPQPPKPSSLKLTPKDGEPPQAGDGSGPKFRVTRSPFAPKVKPAEGATPAPPGAPAPVPVGPAPVPGGPAPVPVPGAGGPTPPGTLPAAGPAPVTSGPLPVPAPGPAPVASGPTPTLQSPANPALPGTLPASPAPGLGDGPKPSLEAPKGGPALPPPGGGPAMPPPGGGPLPPPGAAPVGGPGPMGGPPPGAPSGTTPADSAKKSRPSIVFMIIDFLVFGGAVALLVLLFLRS